MNLSTIVLLIILNFVVIYCGNKLKYDTNLDSFARVNENIVKVFPLFASSTYLCLMSRNEEDILDIFIAYIKTRNKTVSLLKFGQTFDFCDAIIVFEINVVRDCSKVVIKSNRPLYFLNYRLKPYLRALEECLANSLLSETLSISLESGVLFRLNSDDSLTRYFKISSVEEIMKNRLKLKKTNLGGRCITVATDPNPPFTIHSMTTQDQNQTVEFDGIEFMLLEELTQQLNFTTKIILFKNWGSLSGNGKWENGVIPAIMNGEAELAWSSIWMIKTLYDSLDFGPTVDRLRLSFIVRRPEAVEFQWKNLLAIFKPTVWVIILASFAFVIIMYRTGIRNHLHAQPKPSWTGCFLTILGLTIQTSFSRRRIARFVCYILTSWSFISLLLTTILSGNVFCGLTLPQYAGRVDTIEQLVRGNFYWTVQYYARFNSSGMRTDLFDFKNPWVRKFEKQYKYMSNEEVKDKAYVDKKITFLTEVFGNDVVVIDTGGLQGHKALEDFRLMKEEVSLMHLSFGVAKHSPLLEPLTIMTLRFLEAGMAHRWKNQVLRKWPIYNTRHLLEEKDITSFSDPSELSMNKLQPVFYLLLFGLGVSCVVFVFENIW